VLATFVIYRTTNVKEHYWEEDRAASKERIVQLETQQQASKALIAEANARISEANARGDEAKAEAAKAQLELIKFRRPRLPTNEELTSLIEKIKPFSGTRFDVGHARVDREAWDFLWSLEPAISKAGWVHIDWVGGSVFGKNGWPGNHLYGEMGVNNVSIEVRPQFRSTLMPAAIALAGALKAIGIEATTDDDNNSSQNDDAIHLIVGPKR